MSTDHIERVNTLVIGGGQAGLAAGYHLQRAGLQYLIVDANERTGDSWRHRWDSLRLFTPNRFNSLPGLPIPGDDWGFPTKDEAADYLESYAAHFEIPIRHGVRVNRVGRDGEVFRVETDSGNYLADNVIVAMAEYQEPKTPAFSRDLDPRIVQVHAAGYRNPGQLADGTALVVGLGNSGAEIAKELAGTDRRVLLSGEPSAVQPFRPERLSGRVLMPIVGPLILSRLLSTSTPMGRRARRKMKHSAAPLLRVKPKDLTAMGVERVGRVVGVVDGSPRVEGDDILDVANVVWCTGFGSGFSWIDLPVLDEQGDVRHERGVSTDVDGLYFVALKFQHSVLSDTLLNVGRDAGYVVEKLMERSSKSVPTNA